MISQDLIETYQRDGVVCLRDAIPEKWLALGREGIDQNLK
ncbi:MAG TPA: phytanoyl-CoA dioxygenase, partial [Gammaproteobacteria bacterium]|nr:phytanoyl-CoA dioxygenase [Gammaproteobacteria bacterium]